MLRTLVVHLLLRVLNQLLLQHVATSDDFVEFPRVAIRHWLLLLLLIHVLVAVMVVHGLTQMLDLFDWVCHQVLVIMLLVRSLWNHSVWASLNFLLSDDDFVAHLVDSLQFYVLQWHELLLHTIKLRYSVSSFLYLRWMNVRVVKTGLCFESLLALLLLLELLSLLILINGSVFIIQKFLVFILRESWFVLIRIVWWKPIICKLQWGSVSANTL